jgi:hypothetical protein
MYVQAPLCQLAICLTARSIHQWALMQYAMRLHWPVLQVA